jgi:hypothetical protein
MALRAGFWHYIKLSRNFTVLGYMQQGALDVHMVQLLCLLAVS